ncbi:hypothetical protein B0O80DRAFT_429558 [Mortierella sp. GBAus27b]|nr:hypothetical protein B0O80DRAFT_429558 [Mortierella sp. GBAus27b]
MFDHWCKQDSNSYGPEPQQEILIYSSQISLWSYSAKDPVTTIDIQTTRSRMTEELDIEHLEESTEDYDYTDPNKDNGQGAYRQHHGQFQDQAPSQYLSKTTICTTKELQTVRAVINLLHPYAPKKVPGDHGHQTHAPSVALQAPMVLLVQAVLQALTLHSFTRCLSLWPPSGPSTGLQVSSGILFELPCSSDPEHFDIWNLHGNAITDVPNALGSENKATVMDSFLSMQLVH